MGISCWRVSLGMRRFRRRMCLGARTELEGGRMWAGGEGPGLKPGERVLGGEGRPTGERCRPEEEGRRGGGRLGRGRLKRVGRFEGFFRAGLTCSRTPEASNGSSSLSKSSLGKGALKLSKKLAEGKPSNSEKSSSSSLES